MNCDACGREMNKCESGPISGHMCMNSDCRQFRVMLQKDGGSTSAQRLVDSRSNKYSAVKTDVDGITFDSKKEARRYSELKTLEAAGCIKDLQTKTDSCRFPLVINGCKVGTYVADFVYFQEGGERVIEDTKGFRTPVYKLKKKLLKAIYGMDIEEV